MRILGIDPGTATVGYGVVDQVACDENKAVNYGIVQTSPDLSTEDRLQIIYHDVSDLIKEFQPDVVAIEQLFFFKNQKTIITVAQARGVLLLAAKECGIKIAEYTPLQVKQALTGYGKADKSEVQAMVQRMLNLDKIPRPDDAADALAIALCYLNHYN